MSRKRIHRSDDNQSDIVSALRAIGATVWCIERPVDLLVGFQAKNFILECKKIGQASKGLTEGQRKFIQAWKGQVRVVETAEEAIKVVTESYTR